MSNKKNNWLKLKVDFFTSPYHKKLRRIAGGDTFLIIYQKMMLLTVNDEGHYYYQGIEPTIEEELAFILDEEIENVKMTLSYCFNCNLIENINNNTIYLTQVSQLIGKYDNSADRVAKYREIKKLEQKNKKCNALQNVTCNNVTLLEKEKDKDKDKDKDKEKNIKKEKSKSNADAFDYSSFNNDESLCVSSEADQIIEYYYTKRLDIQPSYKKISKNTKIYKKHVTVINKILKEYTNDDIKKVMSYILSSKWHIENNYIDLSNILNNKFDEKFERCSNENKDFINKETKENKTTHDTFKNVERTGPIVVTDW
jgi:predicted phage replisome organizer